MDLTSKSLRQHRAVLSGKQGDRQFPAVGTYHAHRQRLLAELTRSLAEHRLARAGHQPAPQLRQVETARRGRSPGAIADELRTVDTEMAQINERIQEIDRLLAASERPGYL